MNTILAYWYDDLHQAIRLWHEPPGVLISRTGGPAWLIGGCAAVMFLAWTLCYAFTIAKCRRDRTYGFPIVNIPLNIGWECLFAFYVIGRLPPFYFPLAWGHTLWVLVDVVNVVQLFKYGRRAQNPGPLRDWFYPIAIGTFVLAAPASYLFIERTNDVMGVVSSLTIDAVMAALFFGLLRKRPNLEGLSYPAAWFRLIGDVASFVFLFYWWPAQFVGTPGAKVLTNPFGIPRFAGIHEPSYALVNVLYVVITVLDVAFIAVLAAKRRRLRAARGGLTIGSHGTLPALNQRGAPSA